MDSLDIILERYEGKALSHKEKAALAERKNEAYRELLKAMTPEVFLKAAEFLGIAPEKCVVVEDASAGIDAAKAAHMTAAGIGEAGEYEKTDFRIERFSDLLRIV